MAERQELVHLDGGVGLEGFLNERHKLFQHHLPEFAWHSGRKEKPRTIEPDAKTWRGAGRIVYQDCRGRQQTLFEIAGGHSPAAATEPVFQMGAPARMLY